MKTEYLLFNIAICSLSTISAWLYAKGRLPTLKAAIPAILTVSIPYLIWDALVTGSWWSFNDQYILGAKLLSLPLEEILFFVTIPWSCLIVWVNLKEYVSGSLHQRVEDLMIASCVVFLGISLFQSWWYSAAISLLMIVYAAWSKKDQYWLRQKSSLLFLFLCFGLICIFNGYLTARPIVIYNPTVKSNLNVGSVPIEDIGYGLVLVGATAQFYELYQRRLHAKKE